MVGPGASLARLALALALAAALLLGLLVQASAHANYVRSDPSPNSQLAAAPSEVRVWFSEPVDPAQSRLEVYDARRERVTTAAALDPTDQAAFVLRLPALPPGPYTVAWTTLSKADGDQAKGFFAFQVGAAVPSGPAMTQGPLPADDLQVSLALTPSLVGVNALRVQVRDAGGAAPAGIQRVLLRLRPPPPDLGQSELGAQPDGDSFAIPALVLGLPGPWDAEVRVRRADQPDTSIHFALALGSGPAASAPPAPGAGGQPSPAASPPAPTAAAPAAPSPTPPTGGSTPGTTARPPTVNAAAPAATAAQPAAPAPPTSTRGRLRSLTGSQLVRSVAIALVLLAVVLYWLWQRSRRP